MTKMSFKNILLIYKLSSYEIYFLRQGGTLSDKQRKISRGETTSFKNAHYEHYKTLDKVECILAKLHMKYTKHRRGIKVNYEPYDFVITVGGDGTFLEAARSVQRQTILGVNSDPERSIGRFCSAYGKTFQKVFKGVIESRTQVRNFYRIRLRVDNYAPINVLNDILICQSNPAAMSRYGLSIKGAKEEQRSSGIWIATAAGSSGAIKSAGGKTVGLDRQIIQYLPRELHKRKDKKFKFKGAILDCKRTISIRSSMRNGVVYVDGSHLKLKFHRGSVARISHSPDTLRSV